MFLGVTIGVFNVLKLHFHGVSLNVRHVLLGLNSHYITWIVSTICKKASSLTPGLDKHKVAVIHYLHTNAPENTSILELVQHCREVHTSFTYPGKMHSRSDFCLP